MSNTDGQTNRPSNARFSSTSPPLHAVRGRAREGARGSSYSALTCPHPSLPPQAGEGVSFNSHQPAFECAFEDDLAQTRGAFGGPPGKITAIGIMTDTDNTGDNVHAYYGDIVFKRVAPPRTVFSSD